MFASPDSVDVLDWLGLGAERKNKEVDFYRNLFSTKQYTRLKYSIEERGFDNLSENVLYWYCISMIRSKFIKECELFLQNLSQSKINSRLIYAKGLCALKYLEFDKAGKLFIEALESDPYFIEPLNKLVRRHLVDQNILEKAVASLKCDDEHKNKLISFIIPSWTTRVAQKSLSEKDIVAEISDCVKNKKQKELFILAQTLIDTDPDTYLAPFAAGCHMVLSGKSEAARSMLWLSIRRTPSFAPPWLMCSITHWFDGDPRAALNLILIAARAFPHLELVYLWAARFSVELAEYQMAIAYYKKCQPSSFVYNELGTILMKLNRVNEAVKAFEYAITLTGSIPEYTLNAAVALRRKGDIIRSIQLLESISQSQQSNPSFYASLGLNYHIQGKLDKAIELYLRSLSISPDLEFSKEMLGEALHQQLVNGENDDVPGFEEQFQAWSKLQS